MKYILGPLTIIFVFALFAGMWVMGTYNSLIRANEAVTGQWAQVETQYQRRFDLVPNLVNATKGTMRQEQAVFGAIAEARTKYAGAPSGSNDKVQAANQYESAIARLLIVMENYPTLKSIDSVSKLTDELAGTENRIAISRDRYNSIVLSYNQSLLGFPRNLLAGMFGFQKRDFFKSDENAKTAPVVDMTI